MKKEIILEDDINKAYRQYKKFKSILYKKKQIEYKGNSDEIKEIAKVLNIKSRMKRLEYIFDKSCEQIDNKFKDINICEFKCNQCIIQRENKSFEVNGCCSSCRFQSNSGCTTKNLTCKLFFCDYIKEKYDVVKFEDLKLLNLLTRRQRLILKFDLFSSREEVLIDLFFGSIILAAFSQVKTLIRNSYFLAFRNKNKIKQKGFNVRSFTIAITILMILLFFILNPLLPVVIIVIALIEELTIQIYKYTRKNKKEE